MTFRGLFVLLNITPIYLILQNTITCRALGVSLSECKGIAIEIIKQ